MKSMIRIQPMTLAKLQQTQNDERDEDDENNEMINMKKMKLVNMRKTVTMLQNRNYANDEHEENS